MNRTVSTIMLVLFVLAAPAASAGSDPAGVCKDKKAKATGKKAFALLKALGKNQKNPNAAKLASDVSKGQSKFTKSFTKAEAKGGCPTIDDADDLELLIDTFAANAATLLFPDTAATTTTTGVPTTTTTAGTTSTTAATTTTTTAGTTSTTAVGTTTTTVGSTTTTTTFGFNCGEPGSTFPVCNGDCAGLGDVCVPIKDGSEGCTCAAGMCEGGMGQSGCIGACPPGQHCQLGVGVCNGCVPNP